MLETMPNKADIRTELGLYHALEAEADVSQRALSKKLSVSIGFVNALLKRIIRKGWVKAHAVPPRRWAYYVTPKGFREKSRLVQEYLEQSLAFFREARGEYVKLLARLRADGANSVLLIGCSELAEIALLSAHETGFEVVGVADARANKAFFLGLPVWCSLMEAPEADVLLITDSYSPQSTFDEAQKSAAGRPVLAPPCLHIIDRRGQLNEGGCK